MAHKQPTGYIVYRGPSLLTGRPIVAVVLVGKSTNEKTGNMVQTYILSDEADPVSASRSGQDEAVCGACDGAQRGTQKPSVVIVVHGSKASRFAPMSATSNAPA